MDEVLVCGRDCSEARHLTLLLTEATLQQKPRLQQRTTSLTPTDIEYKRAMHNYFIQCNKPVANSLDKHLFKQRIYGTQIRSLESWQNNIH